MIVAKIIIGVITAIALFVILYFTARVARKANKPTKKDE